MATSFTEINQSVYVVEPSALRSFLLQTVRPVTLESISAALECKEDAQKLQHQISQNSNESVVNFEQSRKGDKPSSIWMVLVSASLLGFAEAKYPLPVFLKQWLPQTTTDANPTSDTKNASVLLEHRADNGQTKTVQVDAKTLCEMTKQTSTIESIQQLFEQHGKDICYDASYLAAYSYAKQARNDNSATNTQQSNDATDPPLAKNESEDFDPTDESVTYGYKDLSQLIPVSSTLPSATENSNNDSAIEHPQSQSPVERKNGNDVQQEAHTSNMTTTNDPAPTVETANESGEQGEDMDGTVSDSASVISSTGSDIVGALQTYTELARKSMLEDISGAKTRTENTSVFPSADLEDKASILNVRENISKAKVLLKQWHEEWAYLQRTFAPSKASSSTSSSPKPAVPITRKRRRRR
ncbi:hypothetical protein SJAG_04194 [Schizosaccharomyces japonicus yFS275]|uniref:Uncharacterized protein n=1 Tax=Schizosaccharomyces japonicus (strain yFS275 / FY16936) TaxID=402676 RepID=B6K666_SCHJY|nr:hypothetical protein SJAG_04194 [Schizosaccharomyces japonicus yFS275]EEB09020.1 hypothetical protein SJAG_04194 [Schizosaccharomyces japonicus yFS275]